MSKIKSKDNTASQTMATVKQQIKNTLPSVDLRLVQNLRWSFCDDS